MMNLKQLIFRAIIFLMLLGSETNAFKKDIIVAKNATEVTNGINGEIENRPRENRSLYNSPNPHKTLVFFDCDDVLHKLSDAILQKKYFYNFLKTLKEKYDFTDETLALAFKEILKKSQKEIVDVEIVNLVLELQMDEIYTFCLTQCTSDEDVRNQRIETLHGLGYDFDRGYQQFPTKSFEIDDLKLRFLQTRTTQPVYDRGIIFAGSASKGDTLRAFLDWLYTLETGICELNDLTIVFVDDSLPNVNVVSQTCEELGINRFLGIHFTAVEEPEQLKTVIDGITTVQKDILKTNNKWLSDSSASFYSTLTMGNSTQSLFDFGNKSIIDVNRISVSCGM